MREFSCKSLGNNCGWKHAARTEDLLLDLVAIHLRDVHGVQALTPDMVGTIKQAYTAAEPAERKEASKDPALKVVYCKDLGMNCEFKYIAQTEELIVDGVAVHARDAHGISEFTADMATRVKNLAHEWKG
jgi:predicted small metal-binding protein